MSSRIPWHYRGLFFIQLRNDAFFDRFVAFCQPDDTGQADMEEARFLMMSAIKDWRQDWPDLTSMTLPDYIYNEMSKE